MPTTIAWYEVAPIPMPIYPIFMVVNVLLASLPFLFDRLLTHRFQNDGISPFFSTLVYPLASTAVEYLLMADGPLGSFGAGAYSQADFAALAQLSSVTGLWGITFLVSWFASVVNWAWERGFVWKYVWRGAAIYAAILAVTLLFGVTRLFSAPDVAETVTVASFTAVEIHPEQLFPLVESDLAAFRTETTQTHQRYLDQTVQLAQEGAQIVLWPELAGTGLADDVQALLTRGQAIAREEGIYLAMPTMSFFPDEDRPDENILFVADPSGEIVLEHVKYGGNLLEGTLLGNRVLQTVETPFGTLSGVICWDTDYPTVIQQAGQLGVDILLSPAYLWPEIGELHADMAAFRAIENGVTVIRQADQGVSRYIDPFGRTLVSADHAANERVIVATIPTAGIATLYPQIGDIVGKRPLSVSGDVGLGDPVRTQARTIRGFLTSRNRKHQRHVEPPDDEKENRCRHDQSNASSVGQGRAGAAANRNVDAARFEAQDRGSRGWPIHDGERPEESRSLLR
ncbi:MAG: hypothetical protein HC802_20645 [Caldilineaceae bacterium]|nr:hypothetical protein [Caldilineaceae bacterium]